MGNKFELFLFIYVTLKVQCSREMCKVYVHFRPDYISKGNVLYKLYFLHFVCFMVSKPILKSSLYGNGGFTTVKCYIDRNDSSGVVFKLN